jgi:hypothetical protein
MSFKSLAWIALPFTALFGALGSGCGPSAERDTALKAKVEKLMPLSTASWTAVKSGTGNELDGVWASPNGEAWAVGDLGTILHWNGTAWAAVSSPTQSPLHAVSGNGPDNVWAVGDPPLAMSCGATAAAVVRLQGGNWTPVCNTPNTNPLHAVWVDPNSNNEVWFAGDLGTVLHWNGSWLPAEHPVPAQLTGIWKSPLGEVWVVGAGGVTLHKRTDGTTWKSEASHTTVFLDGVWGTADNDIWAVGDLGTIIHWNGSAWTADAASGSTPNMLTSIWGTGSDLWAVGDGGTVLHRLGGGWLSESSELTSDLFGVGGSQGNDPWAVGGGGAILRKRVRLDFVAGRLGGYGNIDGIGPGARFFYPNAVALDGAGNLFVSDAHDNTIRQVVLATGAVTTLAGSPGVSGGQDGTGPSAAFSWPRGIAADGAGNLYVVDFNNETVRKVVIASGVVTTLAGKAGAVGNVDGFGSAARFAGPSGIVYDAFAGSLFVTEEGTGSIRKVSLTGQVTTLASGLFRPNGVTADGAGSLYVAESGANTIRIVSETNGAISTVAGTPNTSGSADGFGAAASFKSPVGITYAGNILYVTDTGNATIREINVFSGQGQVTTIAGLVGGRDGVDGIGSAARFDTPFGIVADGARNLYIGDEFNGEIRKLVVSTGAVTSPYGLMRHYGHDDGTGAAASFDSRLGLWGGPSVPASDGAGNFYVPDTENHTIRKIVAATGAVTTVAGSPGVSGNADGAGAVARFNHPTALTIDGTGNFYISDSSNYTIRKFVPATGQVTTVAGTPGTSGSADGSGATAQFGWVTGVAADGAGILYVADAGNNTVRKMVLGTGRVTTLAGMAGTSGSADGFGAAARFTTPLGIATDGAGSIYVADHNNHTIRSIAATGQVVTLAGTPGKSGSTDGNALGALFNYPNALAADAAGNVYVAEFYNHTVRKIVVATGAVTTLMGNSASMGVAPGYLPASLNSPLGIALVGSGLLITDENAILLVH